MRAGSTSSPAASGASSTVTVSVPSDVIAPTTARASVEFPTPPGPTRVTTGELPKRPVIAASSVARPTSCELARSDRSSSSATNRYPLPRNWNTVHRLHLQWSKDGTWERIADRLRHLLREQQDRDGDPSATIIDARTARGAATVTGTTRGYDAGKKISGRKTFGIVDTLGLLLAVVVVAANTSDNSRGIAVVKRANAKSPRLAKVWHDAGFKTTFRNFCSAVHVSAEVVKRIHPHEFVVLPKRWLVERTWSWLMNNRRLQLDYERCPEVTEGFIWAASSRLMLRQLAPT